MQTVAIIGASQSWEKYGNKAVRAYIKQGWQVYPVNPKETQIEGLPVYKSIKDISGAIDRVSMYVPSEIGLKIVADIAKKKPKELFFNPGSESEELIAKAQELGLDPIQACSIIDIGEQPVNF
jgi:uncharacterized protein